MGYMAINDIVQKMTSVHDEYKRALASNMGIAPAREKLKNVVVNYYDEILKALKEVDSLKEEIAALDKALEDADNEIKALSSKKKKKEEEDGVCQT